MMRRAILCALGTLLLAGGGVALVSRANADVGVVTLDDGQTYEGEVTQTPDAVTVRARGVTATFGRERVVNVDLTPYPARFRDRLAGAAPQDVAGRVLLAREAFDRGAYDLAMTAIDAALAIDPLDRDARQMATLIGRQIQTEAARRPTPAGDDRAADGPTTTQADARRPGPRNAARRVRVLDEQQVNRVRQLELRSGDRARVQLRSNVRKRFVDAQTNLDFRTFNSRTDVDQALDILRRGTPDMIADVVVTSDPDAIVAYGRRINTAVMQGCATSACHGGDHGGDLKLLGGIPDASTMITNFFLLTRYTRQERGNAPDNDSVFGGRAIDMIDRGNPRESLLYQYALPRRLADQKHPAMRGWDGLVNSERDRLARDLVEWIGRDLSPVRPDYDVTFELRPAAPADGDDALDAAPTRGDATTRQATPASTETGTATEAAQP